MRYSIYRCEVTRDRLVNVAFYQVDLTKVSPRLCGRWLNRDNSVLTSVLDTAGTPTHHPRVFAHPQGRPVGH
jgi:hypothetical protein